ncbi:hypothetical protein GAC87_15075 [Bacteroides thetaiotaomicron]|uniref:Uncharacterized protein n=2 Tax=Bacteroides thetaiotaomicron TaxID=818 RepID=Q8A5Z8_BACTN|nr:hypothetical protein BT_2088 [Bacteroides thetaiotaomicron VPI-5482]KAB4266786.1 hypothetical protein GAO47_13470 [Bacteroides thetaiotaomicron]MSL31285.1 hypothetical protein [Escherichia coli]KAB4271621.1 hypothetical protein GAO40_15915 [Bacteroides thetaiotaomicron]KAB4279483.1 hypothetical protein GAO35_11615 [Bacteroides thetaiotaomicron]
MDSVSHNSDFSFFKEKESLLFCSHHKELDSRFAITLSLSTCIPLFIDVSGMVASVVASMRANGCSHSVSS